MTHARQQFEAAQQRMLDAHGVTAERRFVDVSACGVKAQVLEVGDGPPVLFVIGGGAPGVLWAPLLARLDGYRRIAVDRPGFGLTPRVRQRRGEMRDLAVRFLAGVLDALGLDRVAVVANSMGAWWSTQLALRHPKRVAAMAHIGCPALLLDTAAPVPMRLLGVRGLGSLLLRLQPSSPRQARRLMQQMGERLSDAESDRALVELMRATEALPDYGPAWVELLHAFVRLRGQQPGMAITAEDLRRLTMPLLYVWGPQDPFGAPEVGRRAAAIAPDAELAEVPHGHIPWVSDPDAVATPVRRFLAERGWEHTARLEAGAHDDRQTRG